MTAVKLISLTKEYQNGENYIRAVDDVSFSINEGEFIAVIGASGSGKSTLINLISGLEKPTHGCVYVHDVNLTQLSLEEQISFRRWHIGVIFQKYNLLPAMNVFENIVFPAKLLERNAVKYTPEGGDIHVAVQDWEMYLEIAVTDTGRGIPESVQATIFKRFYREEAVHDVDGIGIGLYLAREIITMQGGYITVESEVGKGSTFSIFLPQR